MNASTNTENTVTITPSVDSAREFIEIAQDFTNPLDIVREAISNSYDAMASRIEILFSVVQIAGENILKILLRDNGEGMDRNGLQAFFDLGNSLRRNLNMLEVGDVQTNRFIGEKGHGTKVYFNSRSVVVRTKKDRLSWEATLKRPIATFYSGSIPEVIAVSSPAGEGEHGTEIEILGYNNNQRNLFTHRQLRDHILWFTKHGSFEMEFGNNENRNVVVVLKGIDKQGTEELPFGHVFPPEKSNVTSLLSEYNVSAPDYYVRKWIKTGTLPNAGEIRYEAVFYVEGDAAKKMYNDMIRRQGVVPEEGMYRVRDRYGLWLAKDCIPVEKKNEWITTKGSEYLRFHAFVNCQGLRLTANRGSVQNTPKKILTDLQKIVEDLYNQISSSRDWSDMDYLRQEATGYRNAERDQRELTKRIDSVRHKKVANVDGVRLLEPRQEIGVYALMIKLKTIRPDIIPFEIVDYDSHVGVDALVKTGEGLPLEQAGLKLVEFKNIFTKSLNHLFSGLHAIVCWKTNVQNTDEVEDVGGARRVMRITPGSDGEPKKYFLDDEHSARKIPVFVLSEYLPAKGIEFETQTENIW